MSKKSGQFVAVSTGMLLAGHISVRSLSELKNADVVFCLVPHPVIEEWLKQVAKKVVSLQSLYAEGKHRMDTYEEMVSMMMKVVRLGKSVCGAFYGHAGVFAWAPHETIRQAQAEGYHAYMEAGISAEACLYADLGIDPGNFGVQSYEASQFLFFNHTPNNKAYLILWQIGLVGEHTAKKLSTTKNRIRKFVEYLMKWYPPNHEVTIYEAQVLPIDKVRKDTVRLDELEQEELKLISTLVIPPAEKLTVNEENLKVYGITASEIAKR
ncbi:MAG: SAM-dependent methyltransferase [Kangiella sp.]|nr:SAM-dependent methyltransferase [Kangiella sp.]